jgi:4-hydroxy-tetrahydrodipicolinate synthase
VIGLAVKIANGRCKVIGGTGSNSTREAVSLTVEAARLGCDAALSVAPYYNRPSPEGLYRHFAEIAKASELPIVLYSIPARCGIEIGVETVVRLARDFPTIVAIKESGGSVERVSALRAALPPEFEILSGDDSLTLPFMAAGAVGVISVASNLIPREVGDLVRAALGGDYEEARRLHLHWYPLFKDLFLDPNPVPIKYALSLLGRMHPDVRLPLCEISSATAAKLEASLRKLNILR